MSTDSIRLGGLTSGFDTEAIVQQMLASDQARIDKLTEKVEINKAKIETWEDIAEQLKSFATSVTALKADGTGSNTLFDDKIVNTTDATAVTASASSQAVVASYDVVTATTAKAHVAYGSQKATTYTLPAGGNIVLGGTTIALTAGDTLDDIAAKINSASYPAGNEMIASVVDERLVLQTENMGTSATIHGTAAGAPPFVNGTDDPANILQGELGIIDGGGNLVNESQASADASFTVNGIAVTRDTNTITDVIQGVTFNLLKAGSATIDVKYNTDEIKETLTDFIDSYNETRDLMERVRTAKINDEDEFGLFASDGLLRDLYNELRSLTTTGVRMGDSEWDGPVLTNGGAAQGATSVALDGFLAGAGTLKEGDELLFAGDTTVYKLQADATIAGSAATISINPPLAAAVGDNVSIALVYRSIEDFGIGVRTDTVSGIDGIVGVVDEGRLDNMLASSVELMKRVFTRTSTDTGQTRNSGVARRLYDWIDRQTKVSASITTNRNIDDVKLDGLGDDNDRINDQISQLETRLAQREQALIRQFAEMENVMAQAQAAGGAISGLTGGGQQ